MKKIYFIIALTICSFYNCGSENEPNNEEKNNNDQTTSSVTDASGNTYKTIKIGNQTWMVENLRTTKYNDGVDIPRVPNNSEWSSLTYGAYCQYNNLYSNGTTYGLLYNWYSVNTGKLAPKGWHVPDFTDWTILHEYVSGSTTYASISGSIAKSLAAKILWSSSSNVNSIGNDLSKNNSTGFGALPGGYRSSTGEFQFLNDNGYWWTSTKNYGLRCYNYYLKKGSVDLNFDDDVMNMKVGLSIRCVKDN